MTTEPEERTMWLHEDRTNCEPYEEGTWTECSPHGVGAVPFVAASLYAAALRDLATARAERDAAWREGWERCKAQAVDVSSQRWGDVQPPMDEAEARLSDSLWAVAEDIRALAPPPDWPAPDGGASEGGEP